MLNPEKKKKDYSLGMINFNQKMRIFRGTSALLYQYFV
jgi:hypothetical protein